MNEELNPQNFVSCICRISLITLRPSIRVSSLNTLNIRKSTSGNPPTMYFLNPILAKLPIQLETFSIHLGQKAPIYGIEELHILIRLKATVT